MVALSRLVDQLLQDRFELRYRRAAAVLRDNDLLFKCLIQQCRRIPRAARTTFGIPRMALLETRVFRRSSKAYFVVAVSLLPHPRSSASASISLNGLPVST